MTSRIDPTVVLSAILDQAAENPTIGPDMEWKAINPQQEALLDQYPFVRQGLRTLKDVDLLESRSSYDVTVINEWLKSRDFTIQLEDMERPDAFYLAAIFEQLVKWRIAGSSESFYDFDDGGEYAGVSMVEGFSVLKSAYSSELVAKIDTEVDGEYAYMMMMDEPDVEANLSVIVGDVMSNLEEVEVSDDFELSFPKVSLDMLIDIEWLLEMWGIVPSGEKIKVAQAFSQGMLKINEFGAHAKVAAAVATVLESMKPGLRINKQFLFWIMKDGVSFPLFPAWIDKEDWKDPGEIGN